MSSTGASGNERIGIVLVHGVGEQRRFEHLSAETTQLILALKSMGYRVSVEPNTTQDSALFAEHESWRADGVAPLRVDAVRDQCCTSFFIHEVWWADLDDKNTLWNQVKFWFWGLGMWGVLRYKKPVLPGATSSMRPPQFSDLPYGLENLRGLVVKARLFGFATVFFLSLGSLTVINYILKLLRWGEIPGDILYQYVGDVKLYQDRSKPGEGVITDINGPRRVAIRRRVVRAYVDAATGNYNRWYVLAHSLGTVVAWNGLMETSHCLPNYLSEAQYNELRQRPLPMIGKRRDGRQEATNLMMPARPVWMRDDDEVLYREELFKDLRGFVTYGCPLDKFAYLWPQIVNINNEASVGTTKAPWHNAFEWLNVFDHTDPVSGRITAFSGAFPGREVSNLPYKSSPVLLISHIRYLSFHRDTRDGLAQRLASWMVEGNGFTKPGTNDKSWYSRSGPIFGLLVRLPMWIAAAVLGAAVVAFGIVPFVRSMVGSDSKPVETAAKLPASSLTAGLINSAREIVALIYDTVTRPDTYYRIGIVLLVAAGCVLVVGLLRSVVEWKIDRRAKR